MRTTLTLDDSLVNELKSISQETGKPFKQVVNETLFIGLQYHKQAQPYRLKPIKLGPLYPAINLDKALQLADMLEDEALITKLEQQK
ncbi:MAG: DUF2191 domain-containing protein [Pseudomonadota bacterium]|nr:DUF2191 domain-containing protein [Pseudomonadota bacterium]